MKIYAALQEDMQQGWVWLQDKNLSPRSIVKITNLATGKRIFCESLQIDQNFLNTYNQSPRITISDPMSSLVISAWYRESLGGLGSQQEASIKIQALNSWYGRFMACIYHPQTVVRVAAWLGLWSIALGAIGVVLGIISVCLAR